MGGDISMRVRTMRWIEWIELVLGLILPSMFLGPFLILGLVVSLYYFFTDPMLHQPMTAVALKTMFLPAVIAVASLIALGMVLLLGHERVRARPIRRWYVFAFGVLGLCDAGYFLTQATAGPFGWFAFLLLCPMIIMLRHLLSIVRVPTATHQSRVRGPIRRVSDSQRSK